MAHIDLTRQKVLKVAISWAKEEESQLTKKVDWQRKLIDEKISSQTNEQMDNASLELLFQLKKRINQFKFIHYFVVPHQNQGNATNWNDDPFPIFVILLWW